MRLSAQEESEFQQLTRERMAPWNLVKNVWKRVLDSERTDEGFDACSLRRRAFLGIHGPLPQTTCTVLGASNVTHPQGTSQDADVEGKQPPYPERQQVSRKSVSR